MSSTATALTIVERVEQSAVVAALDQRSAALMDLLPDEAAVARFRRGVIVAITKNPDLLTCTPESIVMACFEAAAQGLEPTGASGGAHLVPYKVNGTKVAQLIPDYRGVIRLVTKPGSEVLSLEARVVKEGDEFTYELGTDAFVNHVPSLAAGRSAKATTHVYAIARLKNGAAIPDVEDRAGIERIRKRGANSERSPWVTDWDEMAKKSLIKRLSKVLPVRPDVRTILMREDELAGASDEDAPLLAAAAGPSRASQLAPRRRPRNVTPEDAPPQPDQGAAAAEASPEADDAPLASLAAAEAAGEVDAVLPTLVEQLRTNAEASGLQGTATEPQKKRLAEILAGIPNRAVKAVLVAAWGDEATTTLTAAQAQTIIGLADSDGLEPFRAAWLASEEK